MRIIHTADWHLGQSFYEYGRQEEHLHFLAWLRGITKKLEIDILLIAGDIFDTPNPSAESQKMYYSFLRDITSENPNLQIIIIAGNHDSAARLEAPSPLLEYINVTIRGLVRHTSDGDIDYDNLIIPLNKGGYCLAVPFLRQGDCPEAESYTKSIKLMYDILFEKTLGKSDDRFSPVIAMGHLQASGSEISENDHSERIIGGMECETFSENIAYLALGHIHRGQKISGRDNIRYSGAPIPMSFAEKKNKQGVVFVELKEGDENVILKTEFLEFENSVKLLSIPEEPMPLCDVLHEIENLPDGEITETSPYLEIKVLISEPEPTMRHTIENALAGKSVRLTRISATMLNDEKEIESEIITLQKLRDTSPMDIAEKVFEQQYGGEEMPEAMKKLLIEIMLVISD
jgi:exonuclease SbcD